MTVTLKDIANAAGVSHPTVSRALRGHPGVSRRTCEEIQALAKKMGYRPDPALTALAAYRVAIKPVYRYGHVAVLCDRSETAGLAPHIKEKIEGVRRRAGEVGFEVKLHRITTDATEQAALSRMLYHRGIRGVVVCPLPWTPTGFDWSLFTVVGMGENAMPLGVNYVSFDHDHAIQETYLQLKKRGYRNIGFCNLRESEERNRNLFFAAWMKCRQIDGLPLVPPLLEHDHTSSLASWIRKHRFDAIITHHWKSILDLKRAGFRIPDDLGVAGLALPSSYPHPEFAAYRVDGVRFGSLAIDLLQALILKNQFDAPETDNIYSVVIRGAWCDGESVRSLAKEGVGEVIPVPKG